VPATAGDLEDADGLVGASAAVGEQLARRLHLHSRGLQETLDAIVATATETVSPADFAGLIVVAQGRLIPRATQGNPPHILDLLQQRLGAGPCLEAAVSQQIVRVEDTLEDHRWAEFNVQAVKLDVRSMLCAPLWVSDGTLGTLSLYSQRPRAFSGPHVRLTELLATHAALALATAQLVTHLRTAFLNRDVIGQAKGILMERHRITADAAFQRLSAVSQACNRKLVEVARDLVETGQL
jgi:GAF domain-containing protein